jgi:hypothetical protein
VLEKRVLKTMFQPKNEEMSGGWRKLHNEEPHNLYSSLNPDVYGTNVCMHGIYHSFTQLLVTITTNCGALIRRTNAGYGTQHAQLTN